MGEGVWIWALWGQAEEWAPPWAMLGLPSGGAWAKGMLSFTFLVELLIAVQWWWWWGGTGGRARSGEDEDESKGCPHPTLLTSPLSPASLLLAFQAGA